jgi:WD40 repeat protein
LNPADPGGRTLFTASEDGSVRLWDTHSGQQTGRPPVSGEGKVGDVAFNPDGSRLAAGADGTVRI